MIVYGSHDSVLGKGFILMYSIFTHARALDKIAIYTLSILRVDLVAQVKPQILFVLHTNLHFADPQQQYSTSSVVH